YWALVFPLGMYGAATFKMRAVVMLGQLDWAPKLTLAVALAAWAAAFVGMLAQGIKSVRRARS
ncbi:MAG: C4-dicarboxylate ABC transporter, partial [Ilumatobacteraceae bacterium]